MAAANIEIDRDALAARRRELAASKTPRTTLKLQPGQKIPFMSLATIATLDAMRPAPAPKPTTAAARRRARDKEIRETGKCFVSELDGLHEGERVYTFVQEPTKHSLKDRWGNPITDVLVLSSWKGLQQIEDYGRADDRYILCRHVCVHKTSKAGKPYQWVSTTCDGEDPPS